MNIQSSNPFERLWALGYHRLCPIVPPNAPLSERSSLARRIKANPKADARGKVPGVKWPDGTWSGLDFVSVESTPADLVSWHGMQAGVGVKTGQGLVLIDADTKNEAHARIIKDEIERRFGALPVRIGQYPKAGYLVRTDVDFTYTRIEFGLRDDKGRLLDRVEILADGRQFVAYGIHPATGQAYRWPDGMPAYADLPYVAGPDLLALLKALTELLPSATAPTTEGGGNEYDQRSLAGDLATVTKAISALPNTTALFPTRESYRDVGYAIRAALPDNQAAGLELFQQWAAKWDDGEGGNDPDVVAADWHRMKPPYRRGASWLYELAEDHSHGTFSVAERWLEELGSDTPLFPENLPNAFGNSDGSGRKALTFVGLREAAEAALADGVEPLIDGLLDQGAMTVLYGESNSGKTFCAMDMAHAIASARTWGGLDVARMAVAYVAAEGGRGAKKRAAALRARYGDAGDDLFRVLLQPVDLLHADADLRPLIAAVAGVAEAVGAPVGLLVLDTLSRAMAGGDENASTDMGVMVKHLDALRAATGAHVLVVHHSGKDKAKGARGHSLLRAATDTEIEIADRTISVTKQRDLDGEWSAAFSLRVEHLGIDAKGRPITSCTVEILSPDARRKVEAQEATSAVSGQERLVADAMASLEGLSDDGKAGVKVSDLVGFFLQRTDRMSAVAVKLTLRRLLAKGIVSRNERGKWSLNATYAVRPKTDCPVTENDERVYDGSRLDPNVFH